MEKAKNEKMNLKSIYQFEITKYLDSSKSFNSKKISFH